MFFFNRSCTGFGWDCEGNFFAAINDNSSFLYLWNSNSLKTEKIETGLRDPLSFMAWGKSGLFLAIGTSKGNVLLYNQRAGRKIPVLGKHSKRIVSGAWSSDNLLALGSEDKTLSISTLEGDTVHSASLRNDPSQIQFSEMKEDERSTAESTVLIRSMVTKNKSNNFLFSYIDQCRGGSSHDDSNQHQ